MAKRLISMVLLAALCVACGKKKQDVPAATGSATAPTATAPVPASQAMEALVANDTAIQALLSGKTGNVDKVFDRVAAIGRAIDRTAWDPAAVVAAVGKDRAALFTWVRDKTALVPYRGALRGSVGVLMDRVGNSLDRALLLSRLCELAGMEVRLANAQLDPAAVAKLDAAWTNVPRPPVPADPDDPHLLDELAADLGGDPAAIKKAATDRLAAQNELEARTRTLVGQQAAAVAKLAPGTAEPRDASAFADHWWVQVHDGEAWTDLDPSTRDATPGFGLVAATETIARNDLGQDRLHMLAVRVIGEVWHGATREEKVLVEHAFAPAEFYGQRISITTLGVDMPTLESIVADKDRPAAYRKGLAAQTEWVAEIEFDGQPRTGFSVADDGEVYDLATPGGSQRLARLVGKSTAKAVEGATSLFDQLPDGTETPAPKPAPAPDHSGFTAEWIEYELRAPGRAAQIVRRPVFDAIGGVGDARKPKLLSANERIDRGLALTGETELLPLFAQLPTGFVIDQYVKKLAAMRAPMAKIAALGKTAPPQAVLDELTAAGHLPGPLYALATARDAWSTVRGQVYLDRLDLLTQRERIVGVSGPVKRSSNFDIVANHVAAWPAKGTDARAVLVAQGVADTAAEALLVPCTKRHDCTRGLNTSMAFAASGGAGWKTVTSADAAPAAARALVAEDLRDGFTVVMPADGAPTWWRVSRDGEVLGRGLTGGTAITEYEIKIAEAYIGTWAAALAIEGCVMSATSLPQVSMCVAGVAVGAGGGIYAAVAVEGKLEALAIGFAAETLAAGLVGVSSAL